MDMKHSPGKRLLNLTEVYPIFPKPVMRMQNPGNSIMVTVTKGTYFGALRVIDKRKNQRTMKVGPTFVRQFRTKVGPNGRRPIQGAAVDFRG
jgi:hypothetical protein